MPARQDYSVRMTFVLNTGECMVVKERIETSIDFHTAMSRMMSNVEAKYPSTKIKSVTLYATRLGKTSKKPYQVE